MLIAATAASACSHGAGDSDASRSEGVGGIVASCPTPEETTFSFFLVSQEALQSLSGSTLGFGGNLGGLEGADAICQQVAESVSSCQSLKVWHAFLSTDTVNAMDRIGTGPWRDRLGRLVANDVSEMLHDRPSSADDAIKNDLPNEYGIPNHAPKGTQVDNHEILTGTGTDGKVYTQSAGSGAATTMFGGSTSCGRAEQWSVEKATCWNWTSAEAQGCPRVGHSWPRQGSGVNWMSVWNEGGCAPGGTLGDTGGLTGARQVGSAGGYGGFYCFAVMQ
jgi:hypothetical protein